MLHHHFRSISLTPHIPYVFISFCANFICIQTIYFYSVFFSFYLCCAVISTEPCIITGHLGTVGRDEPAAHQMTKTHRECVPLTCPSSHTHTYIYTVTPLIVTNHHRDVHFHHTFRDYAQGHKHHPGKEAHRNAAEIKQITPCSTPHDDASQTECLHFESWLNTKEQERNVNAEQN